jgi:2-polyprenyl-6-methoxyphenol hydroxylase-like FAD-dependent oxidoreductase
MAPVTLRVLISGGGIAGNALAFWLARQGHDITVVERFPSLRASGLQIDLRGAGIEVLRRMGLEEAFRAQAAPEQGMQFVDGSGRRRGYFPANKPGSGRQSFTSEFEIMRGSLCRILYDAANACKTPPKYMFGTSVASFEQKDNSVEVSFEDGKTDTFDLLVGADGQWSRTRRMMLGPGAPDAVQLIPSLYIAYFTMRQPMKKGEEYLATSYMAPGRRGIMTRRHSPEEMQVLLTCNPRPDPLGKVPRGDVEKEKDAFEGIFKGAKWITDDVVKAMKAADDFYCERLGLVKLKSWSSGHVTLIGDAAHCPTAMSGMGTTCAMIGAYILAGEIGKYCTQERNEGKEEGDGLAAALDRYEQRFRPFVEGMQKGIPEQAEKQWTMTGSAFGIGVLNFMMGVASFFKVNIADLFGIRETVEGWHLPDYEGMAGDK